VLIERDRQFEQGRAWATCTELWIGRDTILRWMFRQPGEARE
jgi:hypothetical protein